MAAIFGAFKAFKSILGGGRKDSPKPPPTPSTGQSTALDTLSAQNKRKVKTAQRGAALESKSILTQTNTLD